MYEMYDYFNASRFEKKANLHRKDPKRLSQLLYYQSGDCCLSFLPTFNQFAVESSRYLKFGIQNLHLRAQKVTLPRCRNI